jgi:PEP-CTERM motif
MKFNSIFKRVAVAAAVAGACATASAAVTDLGMLPIGTTNFSNSTFPTLGPTFADLLFFGLPANGGSSYGVVDFPLDLTAIFPGLKFGSIFAFVSVNGTGPDSIPLTPDDVLLAGGMVTPPAPSFSFDLPANSGGGFYLFVSGVAPEGTVGSLYNGSITVTAVPEPESYAMLLAGLGVMGAIAVRRNKAKK